MYIRALKEHLENRLPAPTSGCILHITPCPTKQRQYTKTAGSNSIFVFSVILLSIGACYWYIQYTSKKTFQIVPFKRSQRQNDGGR